MVDSGRKEIFVGTRDELVTASRAVRDRGFDFDNLFLFLFARDIEKSTFIRLRRFADTFM